jgi:hypothetical protein
VAQRPGLEGPPGANDDRTDLTSAAAAELVLISIIPGNAVKKNCLGADSGQVSSMTRR